MRIWDADVEDESGTIAPLYVPFEERDRRRIDDPIAESACPVCKTPVNRVGRYCARCKVAA